MGESDITQRLTGIFRTVLGSDGLVITRELRAGDIRQWDSISHVMLIAEIEKDFSITFKLKDLSRMQCVGDMIEVIAAKLG